MECTRCLLTDDIAHIGSDGECEFCKIHDNLIEDSHAYQKKFFRQIEKIRNRKGFQVLMGISGGVDSSYLLHWAVKVCKLKPLVVHFDNGYNKASAENNMRNLVGALDVTLIRVKLPAKEYNELNLAFRAARVTDVDIPNDMAMSAIMMDLADKYKIKYIFNGHDFRTEGTTPLKWTYMDARYIQSVYKWHTKKELQHFPLLTFWKQLKYSLKGIKRLRPYNYSPMTNEGKLEALKEYDFEPYNRKHGENIYTEFMGYTHLPEVFGIDKSIIYLSAKVRTGWLTKEEARKQLKPTPAGLAAEGLHIRTYKDFDHYNFKRWKPLLWLLAKMKLIPYLFYKKYT